MAISALEALERLKAAIGTNGAEAPEDGYKTIKQWAAEWGMSGMHASRLIYGGVALGAWESKTFRIQTAQRTYPVPHYREIPIRVSRKAKK